MRVRAKVNGCRVVKAAFRGDRPSMDLLNSMQTGGQGGFGAKRACVTKYIRWLGYCASSSQLSLAARNKNTPLACKLSQFGLSVRKNLGSLEKLQPIKYSSNPVATSYSYTGNIRSDQERRFWEASETLRPDPLFSSLSSH